MGLLDNLTKNLDLGGIAEMASNNPDLVNAAMSLLNPKDGSVGGNGGLDEVMGALASGGLAEKVTSWLSQGGNESISGEEVSRALDNDTLAQFAAKAGIDADKAGEALAGVLPGLVDKLSPQGEAPSGDALANLMSRLGGLK
ncbi:MAG: DUF937 domain-containing protein [Xanthomonadales bacterium]|nr:DUF937 domain-containing protein [Gammaproteobacteria bacterium]MBT8049833.1 DUF937 domain-containing protein [Gammaproteobacteria bacterium]MBT8056369.1 DUF937 domain-containing protein [Gammaproteobacteria bacterium]NNJ78602.1 DUF937 domain-containing protein [Xanthomonadales bacterium]NNL04260.1 DUF937 domain-containing protein [Xanthomonadales bacterium]